MAIMSVFTSVLLTTTGNKYDTESWFTTFGKSKYVKIDAAIRDLKNNEFPISIILSLENPYRNSISNDFYDVIDNFQKTNN
jgi:hypothetical protein